MDVHPSASPVLGDALEGIELFDGLDRGLRHRLITAALPRRYQRGELLYAEGGAGSELLLLLSGVVVLFRGSAPAHRAVLAAVRPPSVLGEEAFAGGVPRATSAEALQESFVLALPEPELRGVMRQHPAVGRAARHWQVRQLGRLAELRADDLLLDLPARVAKTLVRLAASDGDTLAVVNLNQATLARLVRGSRQSVNRALQGFVRRGWLRVEPAAVVVMEIEALEQRAGLRPPPRPQR